MKASGKRGKKEGSRREWKMERLRANSSASSVHTKNMYNTNTRTHICARAMKTTTKTTTLSDRARIDSNISHMCFSFLVRIFFSLPCSPVVHSAVHSFIRSFVCSLVRSFSSFLVLTHLSFRIRRCLCALTLRHTRSRMWIFLAFSFAHARHTSLPSTQSNWKKAHISPYLLSHQ